MDVVYRHLIYLRAFMDVIYGHLIRLRSLVYLAYRMEFIIFPLRILFTDTNIFFPLRILYTDI